MIGSTVSHYKIIEKLGEGGMGVVYRAQDLTLDRLVALKFLPPHVTSSTEDKTRFIQEARAAAALAHPNICTVFGVEEQDGQSFIVMEFVDGKTLSDAKSNVSQKQAIDIGIQLADGLAAAHERGIVHRDIKPENIMIRKDGRVQIMDFGLAKLRGATRLTKEGSTTGTAGYMSPEQAQGFEVDHRTDIFSLGVVLYELSAGQSPFNGRHDAALAYEIVNVDPQPITATRPEIDPEIDRIVAECLQKEPDERFQAAKDISKELKRVKRESSRSQRSRITNVLVPRKSSGANGSTLPHDATTIRTILPWIVATVCFIGMLSLATVVFMSRSKETRLLHAYLPPPDRLNFFMYGNESGPASLSPNGRHLAFVAADTVGKRWIYVWDLDATAPRRLEGTSGALHPFWSPDNQFLGYFDENRLKRIDASGGAPMTLCAAKNPRGGTWNADGIIVFSPGPVDPLFSVPAVGGTPSPVTKLDVAHRVNSHRWPSFLPDGKHFLYFARTTSSGTESEGDAIHVASLDGKEDHVVLRASSNAQFASGYLLYTRGNSLVAQRFDLGSLAVEGEAVSIAEGVAYDESTLHSQFTVSQNGVLVYQTGTPMLGSRLAVYDRSGKQNEYKSKYIGDRLEYLQPRVSFDGNRLAADVYSFQSHNIDVWIYDLVRNTRTRFTFAPSYEQYPTWSHDAKKIFFNANPDGIFNLYCKSSDGASQDELILKTPEDKIPLDVSSDDAYLLFQKYGGTRTQSDLWILPLRGNGQGLKPFPFLQTEFNETDARFSPDGRWVAYTSNESGQNEVYIRSFTTSDSRWQVSTSGGSGPRWRKDGKEIYYLSSDHAVMCANIEIKTTTVEVSNVHRLFETPQIVELILPGYDVSADGTKFFINVQNETQNQSPLSLVINWDAGLKNK